MIYLRAESGNLSGPGPELPVCPPRPNRLILAARKKKPTRILLEPFMGQQLPAPQPPAAPTPADLPQHRPAANGDQVFTAAQVQAMLESRSRELQQAADARLSEQSAQFKSLNDELAQLRQFQQAQQDAEAERQRQAADAQRRKDEEELSAKELLRQYREESDARYAQMQRDLAAKDALLAKERELQAIRDHAARRIIEEGDAIMPEFHDYITVGVTSVEDVERNIGIAKKKTADIVEGVRQASTRYQSGLQPVGTGSGSYDYPGTVPGGAPQTFTAEQIAGMVPGSPEHLAARQQLTGLGQAQQHVDLSGFPTDRRMTAFG